MSIFLAGDMTTIMGSLLLVIKTGMALI